ncbi:4Fe-4S dicluster domain-containing protein [Caldanaerovirga acetigignens]|uniref:4Fe-4S dicluster domain-containing protein n=1 Tax=Caldanaerovirga acetigignens TaxID=447595 RepID=UPI0009345918|nr:ferredoxin family protein [Caldanaerovirga acetigignens]
MTKGSARITIDERACKKCGICIAFCPKKVFSSDNDKPVVANPEACIRCMLCELRCPDFAIVVEGEDSNE